MSKIDYLKNEFINICEELAEGNITVYSAVENLLGVTSLELAQARLEEAGRAKEVAYSLYDCIGPTDEIHRCSYGHCGRCGNCDLVSELISKLESKLKEEYEFIPGKVELPERRPVKSSYEKSKEEGGNR